MLEDEKPLSVTVTVNIYCKITCPAIVMFGTQPVSSGSCDIQANTTSEELISAGNNATFTVETGSIARASDEEYCYDISYCEQDGESFLPSHTQTCYITLFQIMVEVAMAFPLVV